VFCAPFLSQPSAGVRPFQSKNAFRVMVEEASQAFSSADLPECLRVIDRHFRGATYSLKSLFRDEQRRILCQIVNSTMEEAEALYRQVYEHHAPLMRFLAELHMPSPPILRTTAEFVLSNAVQRATRGRTTSSAWENGWEWLLLHSRRNYPTGRETKSHDRMLARRQPKETVPTVGLSGGCSGLFWGVVGSSPIPGSLLYYYYCGSQGVAFIDPFRKRAANC
jgi:hypothetical protein